MRRREGEEQRVYRPREEEGRREGGERERRSGGRYDWPMTHRYAEVFIACESVCGEREGRGCGLESSHWMAYWDVVMGAPSHS